MDTPYFIPFPTETPIRIFHRTLGCGRDEYAIASCKDPDLAHRICALLNADEAARQQADENRARAVSIDAMGGTTE